MELEDNNVTLEVVYIARRLLDSACTRYTSGYYHQQEEDWKENKS